MLFNLVKLRYGDAPVFLDVASVITQTGIRAPLVSQALGGRISCNFLFLHSQVLSPRGFTGKSPP